MTQTNSPDELNNAIFDNQIVDYFVCATHTNDTLHMNDLLQSCFAHLKLENADCQLEVDSTTVFSIIGHTTYCRVGRRSDIGHLTDNYV